MHDRLKCKSSRSHTSSLVRPHLRCACHITISLRTFFDYFSPLGRGVLHAHRSLPLPHLYVVRSIRAMLQNAHAATQHGGDIEEATPASWSDIVRLHVCRYSAAICLCTLPQCAYIRIRYATASILPACPDYDLLRCTFRASRGYSKTRLCRGLRFSGSSMRAKQ